MTKLIDLFKQENQSPWLDNLRRGWINSGELQAWLEKGVRGITSNPSIFAKAMIETDDYDEELEALAASGKPIEDVYWELVVSDIRNAAKLLLGLYEESNKQDGYISVEVSPLLAHEQQQTVIAAKDLEQRISAENIYIKVPATVEGIPAIEEIISNEISVNVTLIFSHSRYLQVAEAYIKGLERALELNPNADLSSISSVASFFISRIDVAVDKLLDEIGTPEALALKGKAAVAQGQLAYKLFLETFSGDRWNELEAKGATVQRPLWASTSTKDPSYPDTLYVDTLIGPNTVNTLPDATLLAFNDHGTVDRTVDLDFEQAQEVIQSLNSLGIDLEQVALQLETEGVAAFADSFDEVLKVLQERSENLVK